MKNKDVNLKKVDCATCGRGMEIDKDSISGRCWQCVASGRAFMDPEKARKLPVEDITSDAYIKRIDAAAKAEEKRDRDLISDPDSPKSGPSKPAHKKRRLGQTKLIDKLLIEGKSLEEIVELVSQAIPQYPKEKLPALIKIRQYHVKKSKDV